MSESGVELSEARRQADQINALRHEYPDGGWLSTLVWNTRNNYMAWPDGNIEAKAVQMIVEGFLAELEAIKATVREAMGDCGTSSLTHHLLRKIVPDWENEGDAAAAKANTMCKHGMHFGYCEDCEDERRAGAQGDERDG